MQNEKPTFLSKKEVQFIAWVVGMVLAIAVPFISYGNKIEAMEYKIANTQAIDARILQTLEDIKIQQAKIGKDIEFIKDTLERNNL